VYTYSITEYLVETDNGILSIGAIGQPDVPTVTKTEAANVPKIVINAVVPSGIVDVMEFWITFDTTVSNDANRTYVKIGQFSNTDGSNLSENAAVSYTYSGLSQSDFFVKVRGANNVATGPYSNPTGLIAYVPVVTADTLSNTPVSLGGQLMSLGLLTLLNNLDKLFTGDTSEGSVVDKVFKGFQSITGYDLLGNAQNGTLVINQVPAETASCFLSFGTDKYPADRSTSENPELNTSGDRAKSTGNYYFTVSSPNGAALSKGSGNIKLYKSDGTLVQTVSGSAVTIEGYKVSIAFSNRVIGTDYYIIMDQNVINDGSCVSPAMNSPETWNFHTADPQDAIQPTPTPAPTPPAVPCPPVKLVNVITYLSSNYVLANPGAGIAFSSGKVKISPDNLLVDIESNIGIQFNQGIILGSVGNIIIKTAGGSTIQTINTGQNFTNNKVSELFWISGDTLWINPTNDFTKGTTYYITLPANIVRNSCNTDGNTAVSNSTTITWTVDNGPASKQPALANPLTSNSTLSFNFDRKIILGAGNISIKDNTGTEVKSVASTAAELSTKEG
jgi:hypothetical protein